MIETMAKTLIKLEERSAAQGQRIADLGRQAARTKQALGSDEGTAQAAPATGGLSPLDSFELGERSRALPDSLRDRIRSHLQNGTIDLARVALESAEAALAVQAQTQPKPALTSSNPTVVPQGQAASAALRTSPVHPRSRGEYFDLARTHPELKKQLDADSTFHPEDLPAVLSRG